ncbi:hypothetical protein TVAG_040490 [Trichomonas vaginalis G3]|uniref:Uncharacterized protein n=1 Tax=Trichomonas vaginalis (strain ATCC PRA-98 / G3) TaxID=412133 RepID=A2F1U4_TRIV3|nr:hypothetical protein TVAGG3_0037970 [Trichomonas vaginalis G3]EAY01144.1 hypothetical protein TVAG_040490 [Trichomonas vaginalis G3]KAI5540517.1 hypothetical protein TVAGG3_0037970 [Trichomonas vaginalis G3]|eukprot:XP_001313996.1 hypothetical protein [Trichomonas vaginalis G3]
MITHFDVSKFKDEAEKEKMIQEFADFSDLTRRDLDDIFHIYKRKVLAIFFLEPFACIFGNYLNKLIKDLFDPIHKYLIDIQTNILGLWDRYKDKIRPEFKETRPYKVAFAKHNFIRKIPDKPPFHFEIESDYDSRTDEQNSLLPDELSEPILKYRSDDEIT